MNLMLARSVVAMAAVSIFAGCATAPSAPMPEYVWPLPPDTPRIRFVETFWNTEQMKTQTRSWIKDVVLGPDTKNARRMVKPFAVTTDKQGRIYVTDTGLGTVWVFDREKNEVRFLGDDGAVHLATPSGIAVDDRGIVYVADTKLDRIFAFDQKGKVVLAIGQPDEFYNPSGLAIDGKSGRLYVTDSGRHKVRVYDTVSGKFLFEFGKRGPESGEFNFPTHLFLKAGRLYVSDTMNFRVQVFTLDGRFVRKYGEMGSDLGQLARPKGVAVDSEGHVYVVDAAFANFQIFDDKGDLLMFVGRTGWSPGEFWLPAGLHIDDKDRIYVVDQYNRRLQVFEYLGKDVQFARAAKNDQQTTPKDQ